MNQKNLAGLLGVSQMTISRALNNLPGVSPSLRGKILQTMRRHDYVRDRAAARLRGAPGRVIGVVIPDIANSFFPDLIAGVQNAADAAGYTVLLADSRELFHVEVRQIDKLREFNVDGLIIAPSGPSGRRAIYRRLLARRQPFVFVDRIKPGIPCSHVVSDTRAGARLLGRYLAGKGYRRWGCLEGPVGVSSADEHRAGLQDALREAGLPARSLQRVIAGFEEPDGYRAAGRLLARGRPDVIVAVNDAVAIGAFRRIRERGWTAPDDVALAGFSDLRGSDLLAVPLTTVRERTEEMGPRAFALLLRQIKDPAAAPVAVRLPTELIVRASA